MDFFEAYMESLTRILKNLHIENLSPEYIEAAQRLSWTMGILTAVIILVAVIVSRKNIVLGVFTAIAQVASAVGMQKFVATFLQTDFLHVEYITGSSQAQVDELVNAYLRQSLSELMPAIIGNALYMLGWILLLVFIIKCLGFKPKVFGVFALILNILRYMFLAPYDVFSCVFGTVTEASQLKWDFLFQGAPVVIVLLLLIPCLVQGLRKKKLGE